MRDELSALFFSWCLNRPSFPVHPSDSVGEARPWLQDGRPGSGGPDRCAARQQAQVPERHQAGADAGRPAGADHANAKAARGRLCRPQPQDTRTSCECLFPSVGVDICLCSKTTFIYVSIYLFKISESFWRALKEQAERRKKHQDF